MLFQGDIVLDPDDTQRIYIVRSAKPDLDGKWDMWTTKSHNNRDAVMEETKLTEDEFNDFRHRVPPEVRAKLIEAIFGPPLVCIGPEDFFKIIPIPPTSEDF